MSVISDHKKYIVNNYDPYDLVIQCAHKQYMYTDSGKRYLDFFNGTSLSNLGHCDTEITQSVRQAMTRIGSISRLYYNDSLSEFGKTANFVFGYDKVMPMVTGTDAIESAIKMARYWGYTKKGVPENKAIVLVAKNNYHGRSLTTTGFGDDQWSQQNFGPFDNTGFEYVEFNNIEDLANKASGPNVVGYIFEPIQMMGIRVPSPGYYKAVRAICDNNNILMITDEVQTGLGRTGYMLATEHEDVRADIVVISKSLTNGTMPMSAVLVNDFVVDQFPTGKHGSTFSGHPVACVAATKTLTLLKTAGVIDNCIIQGDKLMRMLSEISEVKAVRGRGLMIAFEVDNPKEIVLQLLREQIITKVICGSIRLSPPLIIEDGDINEFINKLKKVLTKK